jgi:dipeptidyl aminopeptidase/acylaminoacyl peptidase
MRKGHLLFIIFGAFSLVGQPARDQMFNRTLSAGGLVTGGWIDAHWMEDGSSFWFIEGRRGDAVFYKYDPIRKTRSTLLVAGRLRESLKVAAGHEAPGTGMPIDKFELMPGEKSARFNFDGRDWILQMDTYAVRAESDAESDRHKPRLLNRAVIAGPPPVYETLSPDGRWFLGAKNANLYIRSTVDGRTEDLTTDGTVEDGWDYQWNSMPRWAPNSRAVAAVKKRARDRPGVLYPIVHWLKPNPDVEWVPRESSGQSHEYYIVDVQSHNEVRVDADRVSLRAWRLDGSELLLTRSAPKQIELLAANANTGAVRTVLTETTNTFFDIAVSMPNSPTCTPLAGGGLLWLSDRDGWNQIYLYGFDGKLIRKLTQDQRPVERIVAVDKNNGWVYYAAHGGEGRPYDFHLYRVNLNGGNAARLTDALGKHDQSTYLSYQGARGERIQFSPSRQFFLDSHSDVNRPPQTDVRRADGTLVEMLSKANADAMLAVRPNPPEEFTAEAADGTTQLYGVLYKPYDFDPVKKYPIVDFIYAGPQMTRVPRSYLSAAREQAFANLGLILFVVDARGTPERGKAFQDVVYKNIGRNEIPDHVAVLKQLAATRSYLDLKRVAAIGGSFGGYFAIRALLQAPESFQVGVAMAPLSDLRQANHEAWMGKPEENEAAYDHASNLPLAGNLQGHLLLIHGTSDVNAPFSATMQMIDALERANKPYDLVVLPEKDHNAQNSSYSLQALKRYLVEHLNP